MKQKIKQILGDSWNGVAVNGTEYTQWNANHNFFELWKESKDEIKALGYSLYKDESKGWLVTLFGVSEGDYSSYDEYKNKLEDTKVEKIKDALCGMVHGGRGLSQSEDEMIEDIQNCNSIDELYNWVRVEADNPDYMWDEVMNEVRC